MSLADARRGDGAEGHGVAAVGGNTLMSGPPPIPSFLAIEEKKMRKAARIAARALFREKRQAAMAIWLSPAAVAMRRQRIGEAALRKALWHLTPAEVARFLASQQGGWPVGERTLEDGTVERYYITAETP